MIRDRNALAFAAALVGMLLAGIATAEEPAGQEVTIAGMLVGIEEDQDGNPTRVYLQDDNLGPVLVADDAKGKELVARAGTQVEIHGRLVNLDSPEDDFGLLIHVQSWIPLGGNDASEDEGN